MPTHLTAHPTHLPTTNGEVIPLSPHQNTNVSDPPTTQIDAQSVDDFLNTASKVLGSGISAKSVSIARDSDLDLSSGQGAITVRARLPNGLELEASRSLQRHSLRWRRLWPYIAIIIALASAILLAWHGSDLLGTLNEILRGAVDIGRDDL